MDPKEWAIVSHLSQTDDLKSDGEIFGTTKLTEELNIDESN